MGLLSWLIGGLRRPKRVEVIWDIGDCTRRVPLSGESKFQDNLSAICGRTGDEGVDHHCTAAVIEGKNSVMVMIDRKLVGFLPGEEADEYRPVIRVFWEQDKVIIGHARVRAVDPEEAETPNAGVTLWLPEPDVIDGALAGSK